MEKEIKPNILEDRCKACGYCVDACPKDVLKLSERFNAKSYHPVEVVQPDKCTGCGSCYTVCPDIAVELMIKTYKGEKDE